MTIPGGRKFFLSLLSLVFATALVAAGVIEGGTYATIVLGTVGVFVGGNVAQDFAVKGQP